MDKPNIPEQMTGPETEPQTPGPETEPTPETEKAPETKPEQPPETSEKEKSETPPKAAPRPAQEEPTAQPTRDPVLIKIENELEDGLWESYRQMPPDLRTKFKQEGERVAKAVRDGMATGKLTARKVVEIITEWLKMIPGVNKWFLRQEAKIKTDALLRLQRQEKDDADSQ